MWERLLRRLGLGSPEVTAIRDVRSGQVCCIEGVALAIGAPHPAPFSGTPSATLSVEQHALVHSGHYASDSGGSSWRIVNDVDFGQQFYVRDQTGLIRIDRRGWSVLQGIRLSASRVPRAMRLENLAHFCQVNRKHDLLAELERVGLGPDLREVRNWEEIIPHESRVRVTGEVRATGEAMPTSADLPVVVSGFRESPTLLELVPPEEHTLAIKLLQQ